MTSSSLGAEHIMTLVRAFHNFVSYLIRVCVLLLNSLLGVFVLDRCVRAKPDFFCSHFIKESV